MPGVLPVSAAAPAQVDDVVDELERDADLLAEDHDGLFVFERRAGEHHAHLGGGGDQRAGLVGEHLEVVLDRVFAVARPDGLVQLAEAEPFERVGLQVDRPFAEGCDHLAGPREQQVTGEHGDRIAPDVLGARNAAAHLRLVHHVVVVERGEVSDLDRLSGGQHFGGVAVAELCGEQGEHRPHPLAAGLEQVAGRHIREVVGETHLGVQSFFDADEACVDRRSEVLVLAGREDAVAQADLTRQRGAPPDDRNA